MPLAPPPLVPRTARRGVGRLGLVGLSAALLAAAHPAAAPASPLPPVRSGSPASATVQVRAALQPRTELPGTTASAARAGATAHAQWLIGTSGDHTRAARLAAAAGGSFDATLGFLTVPSTTARRVARQLGDDVRWAGPDVAARPTSSDDRPAGLVSPWSRSAGLPPSLTPAPGTLATIGIVDDPVDHSVAELASIPVLNHRGATDSHGTMVASVAAAPYDGTGVVGVAPGAPVLSWGTSLYCGSAVKGITTLVDRGARVINISFAFDQNCFALWEAVSYAYAHHVTIVAAAGNEGDTDNRLSFPSVYPHVITAAAVDSSLTVASFSDYNDYVDLAAPGVDIPVDVPLRFDPPPTTKKNKVTANPGEITDGRQVVSGTSFAAPYISAGVSWLLGAHPELDPSQVAAVLRASARDIDTPGWDVYTGFGFLQIAPSLTVPPPPADPYEPNDYPSFVRSSGTFRQPLLWSGGREPVVVTATGDSADDNIDAYRVRVPAGKKVRAVLRGTGGLVNLFGFDGTVENFTGRPLDSSTRGGLKADAITLTNTGTRARSAFLVVNSIPNRATRLLSAYTLTIKRG